MQWKEKNHLSSVKVDMHSASENETVVQAYLDNEIVLGHIVGPLDRSLMPRDTQISQFLILDIM